MDGSDLKTDEKPSAPRFVIPSAAEGSFWQTHNGRRDTAGKRNTKTSIFIFTLTWITAGQGRFLDFARNDVTRKTPAANVPLSDYTLQRYEKNALRIPPRCELVEEGHTEGSEWMAAICKRVRNHPLPVSSSRAQPRDLSGRPITADVIQQGNETQRRRFSFSH